MLIAADPSADLEIVVAGQVLGFSAVLVVHYEKVRLGVRKHRVMVYRGVKRYSLSSVAEGISPNAAVKAQDFLFVAAVRFDRIKIGMRRIIIRLGDAIGGKVYSRAVRRPARVGLVNPAPRDLSRFLYLAG